MGLKDALGLGDDEPSLDLLADEHAQGDHEPGLEELVADDEAGDLDLTPPPAD